MPNHNSKAGHQAQRTCVVCRGKNALDGMLSFILLDGKLVFDLGGALQSRKFHLCPGPECVEGLPVWIKRYHKKRAGSGSRRGQK
ncbi:MAG: DUF448 domain-containing protein [Candidatus Cloacimonetes bacterium]|nr:DUF448 domain-containing protein [Candidatus Cloacimonadota bacterium]